MGGGCLPPSPKHEILILNRQPSTLNQVGGGCFSFIPDSGFVGTVLVHTLANVSTSAVKYARLVISHPEVSSRK